MYSLNRMGGGFNKPLGTTRQYGTNTAGPNHPHAPNMVQLKPESLGNDHFKFLSNFGIQQHLITDKKFADINSAIPPSRTNFYPTNYTIATNSPHKSVERVPAAKAIPLPAGPITTKVEVPNMHGKPKSCKTPKKGKRKRKQNCKGTTASKPWHKTSLKLEIMEVEDSQIDNIRSPFTPLESVKPVVQMSFSPVKMFVPKFESGSPPSALECRLTRRPSECESEDSFIVFDNSSSCDNDIEELDEFYSSSECDEDDGIASIVSSADEIWPTKRVRFAGDKDLCKIHPMVQWSYAYQKARKGPWEQYALDRTRFQKRISNTESILSTVLGPEHRNKIYNERFLDGGAS